jgi:uncharacterized membrane protein YgcG
VGKIKLLLEDDTDAEHGNYTTYRLVREVTTNLLAPKEVEPEEQILCRDVTSLNFRYYDGDGWVDDWDSTEDANSLPKAVEVEIEVAYFARDGRTVKSRVKEPERRRLIQSFAIPCEAAEETSETSSSGSSSSSGNASGSSSGRPAGGASSGGGGG